MSRTYLRGDLYYADLGQGIGSEQKGTRPVVIIQNNVGNKHSPTVIIHSFILSYLSLCEQTLRPQTPAHSMAIGRVTRYRAPEAREQRLPL